MRILIRSIWIMLALLAGLLLTGVVAYGGYEANAAERGALLPGAGDDSHTAQDAPAPGTHTVRAASLVTTFVHIPVLWLDACDDAFEPNDGFTAAPALPPSTTISAQFCRHGAIGGDPDDIFQITLSSTARIDAVLSNIPAESDLDLYLYDDDNPPNIIAASNFPGTPVEHLLTDPLPAGDYHLRVYPFDLGDDGRDPYLLSWTEE